MMKLLSIVIVAMLVGGCSGMGTHGTSGGSGMGGTGATDSGGYYRDSTGPFDPNDLHHGG